MVLTEAPVSTRGLFSGKDVLVAVPPLDEAMAGLRQAAAELGLQAPKPTDLLQSSVQTPEEKAMSLVRKGFNPRVVAQLVRDNRSESLSNLPTRRQEPEFPVDHEKNGFPGAATTKKPVGYIDRHDSDLV